MALLGLLLALAGSAVFAIVFSQTIMMFPTSVEVLDRVFLLDGSQLYWAGAATAAALIIGMMLLVTGLRRTLAVREDLRRVRRPERRQPVPQPHGEPARPSGPAPHAANQHRPAAPARRHRVPAGDRLVAGHPRNSATTR